ncbi:AraC-type DNA-binding protein [Chitinophaga rupis]|uniref:AraC-type DNA-binding protein n=1 Tax=Chitinophaga rupis TaxID=573321 RepID=A0A1H7VKQ3_9BACT|nr:AraC family transcriptional regulator [Chitinophaga rupis]SEM09479.1 AraC-type DNA-binding protein [Chitinophaga rupis]
MLFPKKKENGHITLIKGMPAGFENYNIKGAKKFYYLEEHHITCSQYMKVQGFAVWQHIVDVAQEEEISPTALHSGLRLNFTLGEIDAQALLNVHERVGLKSGRADLFYVTKGKHDATLPAGKHIFFHLDIAGSLLSSLKNDARFKPLMMIFDAALQREKGHINPVSIPVDLYSHTLILDIRLHHYEGWVAKVYIRNKAWTLLQHFAAHLANLNEIEQPELTPANINQADAIKAYLKLHLKAPFSLKALATALDIRDINLAAQQFKQLHDISIQEFLHYYRMEKAFERLAGSGFDLAFIAAEYGFKNVAAFSRAFEQYFACSPLALIKARKGPRS